jgi:integrase
VYRNPSASGGMRAREALAIRLKDVDFSVSPTKIHIRKEFAKTRVARDIYISDEATHYLKQWLDWKYRNKGVEWPEIPKTQMTWYLLLIVLIMNRIPLTSISR